MVIKTNSISKSHSDTKTNISPQSKSIKKIKKFETTKSPRDSPEKSKSLSLQKMPSRGFHQNSQDKDQMSPDFSDNKTQISLEFEEYLTVTDQFVLRLFNENKNSDNLVDMSRFISQFVSHGILLDDPRISELASKIDDLENLNLTRSQFSDLICDQISIIERLLVNELIIQNFKEFKTEIKELYETCKLNKEGKISNAIPELEKANPESFGVSVCSIDGQRYNIGDSDVKFSVQALSNPINHCIAMEKIGYKEMNKYVAHEPSGLTYNALKLNPENLPHNPLINSGAIMVCSLIGQNQEESARFSQVVKFWKQLSGGKRITYDNSVFLSEKSNSDVNTAIAYLMKSKNIYPGEVNVQELVEFFIQCQALECDTNTLSIIAGTLANGGICPITREQVLKPETVTNCLSIMNSCGMSDYSGEFAYNIGLPSKSGIQGATMIVVPGKIGICVYSPLLDESQNSTRGVQFAKLISDKFQLHGFSINEPLRENDIQLHSGQVCEKHPFVQVQPSLDTVGSLQQYCAEGNLQQVKRMAFTGVDLDQSDYDGRTSLHLAASQGQLDVIKYLLSFGLKNINPIDRYQNTPLDDAKREKYPEVYTLLRQNGGLSKFQILPRKKFES